jgi:hypothetical protein
MRFALQRAGSLVLLVLTFALPAATARANRRRRLRSGRRRAARSAAMPGPSWPAVIGPPPSRPAGDAEDRSRGRPAPAVEVLPIRQRHVRCATISPSSSPRTRRGRLEGGRSRLPRGRLRAAGLAHRRDNERAPANAYLDARLPPAALTPFLERLGGLGTIGRHGTAAEDKTAEVVDVEARLKNMAEFRDSLRKLMATPNARLKDLVEVERELTRVQSELDSWRRGASCWPTTPRRCASRRLQRPAGGARSRHVAAGEERGAARGPCARAQRGDADRLAIALLPWRWCCSAGWACVRVLQAAAALAPDRSRLRAVRDRAGAVPRPLAPAQAHQPPGSPAAHLPVALHRPAAHPGADGSPRPSAGSALPPAAGRAPARRSGAGAPDRSAFEVGAPGPARSAAIGEAEVAGIASAHHLHRPLERHPLPRALHPVAQH